MEKSFQKIVPQIFQILNGKGMRGVVSALLELRYFKTARLPLEIKVLIPGWHVHLCSDRRTGAGRIAVRFQQAKVYGATSHSCSFCRAVTGQAISWSRLIGTPIMFPLKTIFPST